MDVNIRSVEERDQEAIHGILTSPHVLAGSMRMPLAPLAVTRDRLAPRSGSYQLVAESGARVAGFAELITQPDEGRYRHVGEINLVAVHADFLGRGIGRALTEAML